jgi:glycolate oxidase iron-sulfur subunit
MAKRMQRWVLKKVVPRTKLFSAFLKIGRACRSVLPASLAELIPQRNPVPDWPPASHKRIYAKQAGCCGALEHHLADEDATHTRIRHLIDAWWPEVEAGIESIVVTASGCGVMVKDFGRMLAHDQLYADKAAQISALSLDASELLDIELRDWKQMESCHRVAWHSPCTLQHGQKIVGTVESLLLRSGAHLTTVAEAHLCCGSAGTYSLLEPEFSDKLLERKIGNLTLDDPQVILTANIGCQMHLAKATRIPVRHWIEYLADQYINGL